MAIDITEEFAQKQRSQATGSHTAKTSISLEPHNLRDSHVSNKTARFTNIASSSGLHCQDEQPRTASRHTS